MCFLKMHSSVLSRVLVGSAGSIPQYKTFYQSHRYQYAYSCAYTYIHNMHIRLQAMIIDYAI